MPSKKHPPPTNRSKNIATTGTCCDVFQRNHRQQPQAAFTIDLHGCRKEEGISKLTSFLDHVVTRQNGQTKGGIWVLVITGSGAHSSQGPILRGAVEALFQKRGMTYKLLPGRATFMVDASSGVILYGPEQPRDTKVVVADSESFRSTNILASSERWVGTMKSSNNTVTNTLTAHAVDAEKTGKSLQKAYQEQKNEEKAMKKALSMSLMVAEKEQQEEEGLLRTAISLSAVANQEEMAEVEKLQQAIRQSEVEFQLYDVDAEASLLRAIEISRRECYEEDNELLDALEKSTVDF